MKTLSNDKNFKQIDMQISGVPINIIEVDTSTYLVCLFNKLGDICISVKTSNEAQSYFHRLRNGETISCYGYANRYKPEVYRTFYIKQQ